MIRKLLGKDLIAFRALRVRALKEHPQHFGASLADERKTPGKTYLLGFGIGARGNFVLGKFAEEKRGLKVGGRYYDELWMRADFPAS
jgi:hypothetical protein